MNTISKLHYEDYVKSMEKENRILKDKNTGILEKLKCISNVLENVGEININNFTREDVYELDCEKIKAHELLKIVIEQMESWK